MKHRKSSERRKESRRAYGSFRLCCTDDEKTIGIAGRAMRNSRNLDRKQTDGRSSLEKKDSPKRKKQRDKHMLGSLLFVFNGYLMYGYSLRCMQQRQKPVRLVLQ